MTDNDRFWRAFAIVVVLAVVLYHVTGGKIGTSLVGEHPIGR